MSEEKTADQKRIEELEAENAELREKADAADAADVDARTPMQRMADAYAAKDGE